MSLFDRLTKPKEKPVMAVVAGEQGLGKTTLGAMMPKPVLIRIEDGTASIEGKDVAMFDKANSTAEVLDSIKMLATEDHDFKTLVIDSVTAYDALCVGEVAERNNTANLSACDGGFGGGFHSVRSMHEQLYSFSQRLSNEKGMNVLFISHTETEEVNPPDAESYTRYNIQGTKSKSVDCMKIYTNNCDLVAFIKLNSYVIDGKAKSDGCRVITCYPSAAHVSKNRYGISEDIEFNKDENPFTGIIKQLSN